MYVSIYQFFIGRTLQIVIFLIFQQVKSELEPISVEVKAHDPSWIKEQNMGSFLSVSHGSAENPVFLEMSYNNTGHLILPCHEKSNKLYI